MSAINKGKNPMMCDDSNCVGADPDLFFPERGRAQRDVIAAKRICEGRDGVHPSACPRLSQCLEYAIASPRERFGVWGGMSEPERTREVRRRRLAAVPTVMVPTPLPVTGRRRVVLLARRNRRAVPSVSRRRVIRRRRAGIVVEEATVEKKTPRKIIRRRGATGELARFAETRKEHDSGILSDLRRHLLAQPQDVGRHHELIHVSEIVKRDWCPRAAYLRIRSVRRGTGPPRRPPPHFQLDTIFAEGNTIHAKWQDWCWDMGGFFGEYRCTYCDHRWLAESPQQCEVGCGAGRSALEYCEVPMIDKDHLLVGHADGEIHQRRRSRLIEVKSIGQGTVRVEAPRTLVKHSHRYTDDAGITRVHLDHDALWRDLHRPFNSHLGQGKLYLHLRQHMTETEGWPPCEKIVFLYEYKPTQAVKEFVIGPDDEYVAEVLDSCKDVIYALDSDIAPYCLKGRGKRCNACEAFEVSDEHTVDAHGGDPAGQGEDREALTRPAPTARRTPRVVRRPQRRG